MDWDCWRDEGVDVEGVINTVWDDMDVVIYVCREVIGSMLGGCGVSRELSDGLGWLWDC